MTKQTTIAKRYAAALAAAETAKTQAIIDAIEARPEIDDDTAGSQVIRAGRVMLRLAPKAGRATAITTALKKIRKPAAKRGTGAKWFPPFFPGMSTHEYVHQFFQGNSAQVLTNLKNTSYAGVALRAARAEAHTLCDAFFQPMNQAPCTLYENGALDFDAIEETDTAATDADRATVAAVVATAQALANAAQAPAMPAAELATVCAQGDTAEAGATPSTGHAAGHQADQVNAGTSGPASTHQEPRLAGPGVQDLDPALAERLQALRKALGLSVNDMAQRVGLWGANGADNLRQMERCARPLPGTLQVLLKYLEQDVRVLGKLQQPEQMEQCGVPNITVTVRGVKGPH